MKPELILKLIDAQPYGWVMAGIVITLCIMILAPFIRDSFGRKRSA